MSSFCRITVGVSGVVASRVCSVVGFELSETGSVVAASDVGLLVVESVVLSAEVGFSDVGFELVNASVVVVLGASVIGSGVAASVVVLLVISVRKILP